MIYQLMNIFGCVKQLDHFGIPIALKAYNNQKKFKSIVGGVTTFLIYSFYLAYLIYILILWWTNQIQPSSVRFSEGKNLTTHKFQNETIFEICYWKYMEGIIDPFTEQDNILMPLFMYYVAGVQQPKVTLLKNTRLSKYNSTLIQINNLDIVNNNNGEENIKRQEGFIIITDCDPQYLEDGQSCASEERVKEFKKQTNYISYFTYISAFNTNEIKTNQVAQELFMSIDFYQTFMVSLLLQQVKLFVNVGLLFQDVLHSTYIESYQSYYQQQNFETSIKLQGKIYYFGYHIRLNPIIITQGIRYQNIGEILAQVGSILTLLMMLKSSIEYYNAIILDNMMQFQILNQWFPQQISMNKYGYISIIAGYKSEKKLNRFKSLADSKLDIIDIIYQIQRIQLILIKKFGRNEVSEANSYVIQPHASLSVGTETPFEREDEFYIADLNILKYQYQ